MNKIQWNDGMSVGVESIDNDHKKLILIISELSDAIEDGKETDTLEKLFDQLSDYAHFHFKREEALIKHCNYHDYDNHVQQHHGFVDKIPELKSKLLNADSMQVALEVNLFLYQWLINHILVDDMAFFNTLLEHGCIETKGHNESKFSKLTRKTSQTIQLSWRVLLSSLIPITAFVVLAGIIIIGDYVKYHKLETLENLSHIVHDINEVTQQIQRERGLTVGYISSEYLSFEAELGKQKKITDEVVAKIITIIELSPNNYADLTKDIKGFPNKLESIRVRVNQLTISSEVAMDEYTLLVTCLFDFLGNIANLKMDNELSNRITAMLALFNLKESIGQERVMGTQYIEQGDLEPSDYSFFLSQKGRQQVFFETFKQFSHQLNYDERTKLHDSEINRIEQKVEQALYAIDSENAPSFWSSSNWFRMLSSRIEDVGLLTKHLVEEFDVIVKHKMETLEFRFYITVFFLIGILSLSILASWLLNRSIILPVQKITEALRSLAQGKYNYRFTESLGNDELSKMVDSYEYCRVSLLQSEIKSHIRFKRKDMDLLSESHEKARYEKEASIDPLTGALNRRKLDELAHVIIGQAQRYNHPLSIMMLDIDFFKKINDTYGHTAGDIVLQEFVQTCQKSIRETDMLARFGGEEFIILLPETESKQAIELAERIRINISELLISACGHSISLTVSIGVACWEYETLSTLSELEALADKAVYKAKKAGRNRVVSLIK